LLELLQRVEAELLLGIVGRQTAQLGETLGGFKGRATKWVEKYRVAGDEVAALARLGVDHPDEQILVGLDDLVRMRHELHRLVRAAAAVVGGRAEHENDRRR